MEKVESMKKYVLKVTYGLIALYMNIKWWPWNPWCVARLNLALKKYMETTMYEERVKSFGDKWAIDAFEKNAEAMFFAGKFTIKDTFRMVFTPFSCGDYYTLPWWQIQEWWWGGEDEV